MRKFFIILLCVILTLSLAACKPANTNQPSETPNQTLPPVIDNPEDAPLHTFYAISVPAMTEYLTYNDGTQLFEYSYQHIQMQIADQAVADKITLEMLASRVHFNKTYFIRRFKSLWGCAPMQYVNQLRLQQYPGCH